MLYLRRNVLDKNVVVGDAFHLDPSPGFLDPTPSPTPIILDDDAHAVTPLCRCHSQRRGGEEMSWTQLAFKWIAIGTTMLLAL